MGSVCFSKHWAAPSSPNSINSSTIYTYNQTSLSSLNKQNEHKLNSIGCMKTISALDINAWKWLYYYDTYLNCTCPYRSMSSLSGSFRYWIASSTMSHCPLLMSEMKLSMLSTVWSETAASSWSIARVRWKWFSFRYCMIRRITLRKVDPLIREFTWTL